MTEAGDCVPGASQPQVLGEGQLVARSWRGVASLSQSVWAQKEPRCAKFVFNAVQRYALAELTRQRGGVRFIQVGANDGIWGDVLNEFIMGGQWTGVLVEPSDSAVARLEETYRGVPGLSISRKAIWTEAGKRPFYMVDGADALCSFSLETILLHTPKYDDLPGMIRAVEVETTTLDALADDYGMPCPDVIAVDAEGCDDVVLQSFNIEARTPALILFEHVALSTECSSALQARLAAAGYLMIADRHDVLAVRHGAFSPYLTEFFADVVHQARNN